MFNTRFLLRAWNLGLCQSEAARVTSLQWKPWALSLQGALVGVTLTCRIPCFITESSVSFGIPRGEGPWMLVPGFPHFAPCSSLAAGAQHPFAIIHQNHEHQGTLSPVSPSHESSNLRGVVETSGHST